MALRQSRGDHESSSLLTIITDEVPSPSAVRVALRCVGQLQPQCHARGSWLCAAVPDLCSLS
jgi:hypothetical protein